MSDVKAEVVEKEIQELLEKIKNKEEEVKKIRAEIELHNEQIGFLRNKLNEEETDNREHSSDVLNAVKQLLKGREEATSTMVILEELNNIGIKIVGSKPRNNLAALLSYHRKTFESCGREGWRLRLNEGEEDDR